MMKFIKYIFIVAIILVCAIIFRFQGRASNDPPYPKSMVIDEITWDFDKLIRMAPGSDLWPITWGADNNLYTSWGDGGGFGGTNQDGRVSLGFARIIGGPVNFETENVWGGKNPANPAQFGGKSPAMLSVEGTLYAWINMQNGSPPDQQLIWSDNLGSSWQRASWIFPGDGPFFPNNFLNFGRDYENARDNHVYIYGSDRSDLKHLFLARVSKEQIKDIAAYEFFNGFDGDDNPTWATEINQRQPVFTDYDQDLVGHAIVYSPGINRYLLSTHHGYYTGRWGIFDAPEPWGPWTTVAYYSNWGGLGKIKAGMPHSFPVKWISSDGLTMYMIFSGTGIYDSFNLIKVTLKRRDPDIDSRE